ncbi:MAG TPA: flagellar biosynthetic protein FliQ [Methylomirabilota bacterium]|nr:flagellar biosynthetic protein FliQ [Methylomirabilota bacterium]
MSPELAIEVLQALIWQAVSLSAPILVTAMGIGLSISLVQTVTSIHEQTLSFVPKVAAIAGTVALALPWIVRTLMQFTIMLIERIPDMAR